ncbi:MAG: hypothetical protein NTW84_06385, partial [Methanothrix sp.]|nr:hypothetical protein [Methanothrix sp.]
DQVHRQDKDIRLILQSLSQFHAGSSIYFGLLINFVNECNAKLLLKLRIDDFILFLDRKIIQFVLLFATRLPQDKCFLRPHSSFNVSIFPFRGRSSIHPSA